MNVGVLDEIMLFDGKSVKVNDRILYSFADDLSERFSTHFATWCSWIQEYINDFLKGNEIEDFPYKESIYYEIKDDSLFLVDGRYRCNIITFGTEKPEVRRVIAIGAFEYYIGMV